MICNGGDFDREENKSWSGLRAPGTTTNTRYDINTRNVDNGYELTVRNNHYHVSKVAKHSDLSL